MEFLLIVGVIGAVVWWFRRDAQAGQSSGASSGGVALARLGGTGDYDFAIVGESKYQPALKRIAGKGEVRHKCTARIYLEDSNPYDAKAVRVDIDGDTVGYFSREDAQAYRKQVAMHGRVIGECGAMIVGGGKGRSLGVWLDLPVA